VITLFGTELSVDAYRVRLFLALLALPYRRQESNILRLDDDGTVLEGSDRILIHLAHRHNLSGSWRLYGSWLDVGRDLPSRKLFRQMDEHLWFAEQEGPGWLCGGHPTIADLACFPAVVLSESAGVSRLPFPALRRWSDRIRQLPGFVAMPGIFV